jgi:hypothetical protein
VLGAIVLSLWVRSYWVWDEFAWQRPTQRDVITSVGGRITWYSISGPTFEARQPYFISRPPMLRDNTVGGISTGHLFTFELRTIRTRGGIWRFVGIPYWSLFLPLGLLPLLRLIQQRRIRGLAARGLCTICGYDLRATPDRCPECGTVPEQKSEVRRQRSPAMSNSQTRMTNE